MGLQNKTTRTIITTILTAIIIHLTRNQTLSKTSFRISSLKLLTLRFLISRRWQSASSATRSSRQHCLYVTSRSVLMTIVRCLSACCDLFGELYICSDSNVNLFEGPLKGNTSARLMLAILMSKATRCFFIVSVYEG